jgi:ribonuclease Z
MDLLGRTRELHIHAFEELNTFMNGYIQATHSQFQFPIHIHIMPQKKEALLFENEHLTIHSFPVKHRVPCNGFIFKEKTRLLNLKKEAIEKYHPSIEQIHQLKKGEDLVLSNGTVVPNANLTTPPPPARSYAFVTDTVYLEKIVPIIQGVDLLYHESTFTHDMIDRAKSTMHSTALQAANMATLAGVKKLLLGHYSVRYEDLNVFLNEASPIFENTLCAYEGLQLEI